MHGSMSSVDDSCVRELIGVAQAFLTPKGYHSKPGSQLSY